MDNMIRHIFYEFYYFIEAKFFYNKGQPVVRSRQLGLFVNLGILELNY